MAERLRYRLPLVSKVKKQFLVRRPLKFWVIWLTQRQRTSFHETCSLSDLMPSPNSGSSLRQEFNKWAEAGRGEGMEQEHLPITLPVLEKMRLAPADNVLDIGCGAGWLPRRLAKLGPEGPEVGIDLSHGRIRHARRASGDV